VTYGITTRALLQDLFSPSNPIPKREEDTANFSLLRDMEQAEGSRLAKKWGGKVLLVIKVGMYIIHKVWLEMCHGMRVKRERGRTILTI